MLREGFEMRLMARLKTGVGLRVGFQKIQAGEARRPKGFAVKLWPWKKVAVGSLSLMNPA